MSKYSPLWEYIVEHGNDSLILSFGQIEEILGLPIDHSFLSHKKELTEYGYEVGKISMKNSTVAINKIKQRVLGENDE